ncbi:MULTISPECIES: hypothetical protein [Cryobacterium]|nr:MULTISPECIES: hypothetical protein [Cryobacterium]
MSNDATMAIDTELADARAATTFVAGGQHPFSRRCTLRDNHR